MTTFEDIKKHSKYFIRNIDSDFAIGNRKDLRYAVTSASVNLGKINPKGPDILDYLNYAKEDIRSKGQRGAINALGNAKRAIHLTIDTFFRLLCLDKIYSRSNFPTKIDILDRIEAFPTGLIKRLNQKRNYIEHEYEKISNDEAIDLIEIAELFVLLTYPYLKSTVVGVCVGIDDDNRCLEWVVKHDQSEIHINELKGCSYIDSPEGRIFYNIKNDNARYTDAIVEISRENIETCLPYFDLFMYCTKKGLIELQKDEDDYEGIVLHKHEMYLF